MNIIKSNSPVSMDRKKKLESVQATGQEDAKFSLASAFMLVLVVMDVVFC